MLKFGEKKNRTIQTLVLSEKKNSERNKKPYPPLQVKWSVTNISIEQISI